jgi:hypothetical protein
MSRTVCGVLVGRKVRQDGRAGVLASVLGVWWVGGKQTREQKVEDMRICGSVCKGMRSIDDRGLRFMFPSLVAPGKQGPADVTL